MEEVLHGHVPVLPEGEVPAQEHRPGEGEGGQVYGPVQGMPKKASHPPGEDDEGGGEEKGLGQKLFHALKNVRWSAHVRQKGPPEAGGPKGYFLKAW